MPLLSNPHLDLTTSRIETERCLLVPVSLDAGVDIEELTSLFAKVNKNLWVAPHIPSFKEEENWVRDTATLIARGQEFENFILGKDTRRLIGCAGLRILESGELNIGIWIREEEQGKGYASEVYRTLIDWARVHTDFPYLIHSIAPENAASRWLVEKFGGVLQKEKNKRGFDIYHISLHR